MTVNCSRAGPYDLGSGQGHVAFVDDLDAEHRRFEEAGFVPNPIKELKRDGERLARFLFVADPDSQG